MVLLAWCVAEVGPTATAVVEVVLVLVAVVVVVESVDEWDGAAREREESWRHEEEE